MSQKDEHSYEPNYHLQQLRQLIKDLAELKKSSKRTAAKAISSMKHITRMVCSNNYIQMRGVCNYENIKKCILSNNTSPRMNFARGMSGDEITGEFAHIRDHVTPTIELEEYYDREIEQIEETIEQIKLVVRELKIAPGGVEYKKAKERFDESVADFKKLQNEVPLRSRSRSRSRSISRSRTQQSRSNDRFSRTRSRSRSRDRRSRSRSRSRSKSPKQGTKPAPDWK